MASNKNVTINKKKTKSADGENVNTEQSGIWKDERFQHLVTDPRFRSLPQKHRKIKIDNRFQGMFTDDKFKVKYTVDKYGRRVNKSNSEDLRKYYEIDSSDDSSESESSDKEKGDDVDEVEKEEKEEQRKEEKALYSIEHSEESSDGNDDPGQNDELEQDDEQEVPKTIKERLRDPNIDYSRGEGRLITDSSSDDESSEDENPEMLIDHVWGELDNNAETTEELTHRLAVCNMDWDRIRAIDLMMLFSSFLNPGGSILSIKIFPSEFGKQRLAEEEVHGPSELVGLGKKITTNQKSNADSDSDEDIVQDQDSDAEQGDEYHMEKLRQYQLNRLKYYYAVVECDSVRTADRIYQECDGIEYESSATRVDLRFISDDTTFNEDEATDVCTELPDSNAYKPRQFTTKALHQAKVDLTWDETAVDRKELGDKLSSGKLDDVSEKDLRKIIAFSSEEEDAKEDDDDNDNEGEENSENSIGDEQEKKSTEKQTEVKRHKKEDMISKYKALLADINEQEKSEKNKQYAMEFSWNVDDSKKSKNDVNDDHDDEEDDDDDDDEESENLKLNENTTKQMPALTPIEKVIQKRSEKNKKRKEERKKKKLHAQGIYSDEDDTSNNSDDYLPDRIDLNDPYFAEEFANGDFIDKKSNKEKSKQNKKKNVMDGSGNADEEQQLKELQLLVDDDDIDDNGKQHFSLEKIMKAEQETKSKKKRKKQLKTSKLSMANDKKELEDTFQLNIDDKRFGAIYTSHLFNIDPTDSHFKKTKGMEQIIEEKLKRRHEHGHKTDELKDEEEATIKKPKKQLENLMIVKSLKRKIQMKNQNLSTI